MPARRHKKSLPLPASPRTVLTGLDPVSLAALMDREFVENKSNYWTIYEDAREYFLKREGNTTVTIATLLEAIDDCLVEAAFRQAGFVIGFEVCRALLLGELDLNALNKRAADAGDGGAE